MSPAIKTFRDQLIEILKGAAVKAALIKLLGSAALVGPRTWAIKFIVENLFNDVAEPLVKVFFNQIGYQYDRIESNITIKKLKDAQKNNDKTAYNVAVDDIYS